MKIDYEQLVTGIYPDSFVFHNDGPVSLFWIISKSAEPYCNLSSGQLWSADAWKEAWELIQIRTLQKLES